MKTSLFTLFTLLTLSSCLPQLKDSDLNFKTSMKTPLKPEIRVTREVSFETLKSNLLDQKCIGCHSKWTSEEVLFEKYVVPGNPEASKLYDSVKMGRMPKGPKLPDGTRAPVEHLNSEELDLVYSYIQSAKPTSFEKLSEKVLVPKCIGCHSKWTTEEAFLEKNVVRGNAEASKVYDSVVQARMPKGPKLPDGTRAEVVPLSAAELSLMRAYLNALKPEVLPEALDHR